MCNLYVIPIFSEFSDNISLRNSKFRWSFYVVVDWPLQPAGHAPSHLWDSRQNLSLKVESAMGNTKDENLERRLRGILLYLEGVFQVCSIFGWLYMSL